MKNLIFRISILFLASSCIQTNSKDKKYNWTEQEIKQYFIDSIAMGNGNSHNPDSLNKFSYFIKTFYGNSNAVNYSDEFIYALDEPYIDTTKIDNNKKWFRLTVKPTFSNPFCITLDKLNKVTKATFKMTNGQGGYFSGYLKLSTFSYYSDSLYNSYNSRLDKIKFWEIKGHDSTCDRVLDGTSLVFESIDNGKYNIVFSHSPWNCTSKESQEFVKIFEDLYKEVNVERYVKLYDEK